MGPSGVIAETDNADGSVTTYDASGMTVQRALATYVDHYDAASDTVSQALSITVANAVAIDATATTLYPGGIPIVAVSFRRRYPVVAVVAVGRVAVGVVSVGLVAIGPVSIHAPPRHHGQAP